jgi:hypothetical protein
MQNACIEKHKQKANQYFFNFKIYYYIFGAYMLQILFYKCLLIQVQNLNVITKLAYC